MNTKLAAGRFRSNMWLDEYAVLIYMPADHCILQNGHTVCSMLLEVYEALNL